MSKVVVDGEEIELCDKLEEGELELDTMDGFPVYNDLDNTQEMDLNDLDDTMDLGEGINE